MTGYIYRFFRSRWRLSLGLVVGIFGYLLLIYIIPLLTTTVMTFGFFKQLAPVSEFLLAWNMGVWVYLGAIFWLMHRADGQQILDLATAEDEGTPLMLILVVIAALVSIVAITQELSISQVHNGVLSAFHVGLTCLTIVSAWLLIHTLFALHYAHDYYLKHAKAQPLPISFPDDAMPNYWDFLYFSYIIGTSGQTADVSFTSRSSRKLGTLHCVLAFFFNAAILASLINLASGLIG